MPGSGGAAVFHFSWLHLPFLIASAAMLALLLYVVLVRGSLLLRATFLLMSSGIAVYVGGLTLAITSVESMLVTPWLLGRAVRMNNVAVFGGLLFWGWLWGPWGLALSLPMMAVIKTVADRVGPLRPVGEVLGR